MNQAFKKRSVIKYFFRMAVYLMASGIRTQIQDMVEVIKSGLTARFMTDTGKMIRQMVAVDLSMLMVTYMMATGKMTKPTVLDSTSI